MGTPQSDIAGSTSDAYGGPETPAGNLGQQTMNVETPRNTLDLSSSIAEGDIRVLLMVLVHMTGDQRWLEPPYKPKRDVRLIPDPQAGVPQEIQYEIRAAVLKLFADGEPRPAIADPGNELMLKMMRACLGENVTPEYAPLMREEMGFTPREVRWSRGSDKDTGATRWSKTHLLGLGALQLPRLRATRSARDRSPSFGQSHKKGRD